MVALVENSKIFSFMPSLAHLAVGNVAARFFPDVFNDVKTLERVYEDIQHGISASLNDQKAKKIEERLLLIPAHLRHTVVKAIFGLRSTFSIWTKDHFLFSLETPPTQLFIGICCRLDFTIKINKTAELIVLNKNINIRDRFRIACMYCLEDSVLSLWREMEASGETNFEAGNNVMVDFWIRRIQEGSPISWLEDIKENLTFSSEYLEEDPELMEDRFLISPFFNLLRLEERERFLPYLTRTTWDDVRISLRYVTKDEEEKILEYDIESILVLYLHWPLQSLFLEVTEKVWHFLDVVTFIDVLMTIWQFQEEKRDFDYHQLFVDFWNRSPLNLKEAVKEYPTMNRKINAILNKIRKRKRRSISGANQNKWLRRGGRLENAVSDIKCCLTSTY